LKIHWKNIFKLFVKITLFPFYTVYITFRKKHISIIEARKKHLSKLVTKYCNTNLYGKKMCPMGISVDHFRGDIYSVKIARRVKAQRAVARWHHHFKVPHTSDYDILEAVREGLIELYELKPGKNRVAV